MKKIICLLLIITYVVLSGCSFPFTDRKFSTEKEKQNEIQEQKPSGNLQQRVAEAQPKRQRENVGALPSHGRCSFVECSQASHQEGLH